MKRQFLALSLLTTLSISSCGQIKHYETEEYKTTLNFRNGSDKFNIMYLSDIHFGISMDYDVQEKHMNKIFEDAKSKFNDVDLVVINGDSFIDATKQIVNKFVELFDSYKIPWAYTYGNHDLQGDYDHYYINEQIKKSQYGVLKDFEDDDIEGLSNYYLNINDTQGQVKYRVSMFDSGSYKSSGISYDYGVISDSQIDFFKKYMEKESNTVPGLAFFHIPLFEYKDAWSCAKEKVCEYKGENLEGSYPGYKNTGMFDLLKENNYKSIFVGHDHLNYSDVIYNDVQLSYALKTTNLIYHNENMLGYKMISLDDYNINEVQNITAKSIFDNTSTEVVLYE